MGYFQPTVGIFLQWWDLFLVYMRPSEFLLVRMRLGFFPAVPADDMICFCRRWEFPAMVGCVLGVYATVGVFASAYATVGVLLPTVGFF